jgi:uncharacterized protein YdaU (DUF1376 family)
MKVRRVDFYPDEFVSGVVRSRLTPAEQGVYWMVCALIYSHGEAIDNDHLLIAGMFPGTHWRSIRSALDSLISKGKIDVHGDNLMVKRCADELQRANKRTAEAAQNGAKGGRPRNENNGLPKAGGFHPENLTTNYQLVEETIVTEGSKEPSSTRPKPAKRRVSYSPKFLEFWSAYPTDSLMSKADAGKAFERLSEEDQNAAIQAIPAFKSYCAQHTDYRPVHAVRFLTQGRFEGFNKTAVQVNSRAFVAKGSPEWEAIRLKRNVASLMEKDHQGKRGWWFEKTEIEEAMNPRRAA